MNDNVVTLIKTIPAQSNSGPTDELVLAARQLASEFKLELVVLFGSAARRDRDSPADLDIGIQGQAPIDMIAATNRMIQLLRVQAVDLVDMKRGNPVLLAAVARDGVHLFEDLPGRFTQFAALAMRRFADTRKFRDAEERQIRDFIAARQARR